jgi:hypothetical protein
MKTIIQAAAWWMKSGWVFVALSLLILARWVDTSAFPVIDKFTITSVLVVPTGVEMSGNLHKPTWRESCRFDEVVAHVNDSSVAPVQFLDRKPGQSSYTRPAGDSSWGPWRVEAEKIEKLRLVSRHHCHGLWDHTTTLAEIVVKR